MPSLAEVFRTLNDMKFEGIITDYAIGGGMAALFYAEAMRTYDIDVFALIPQQTGPIISLAEIYEWARKRGFETEREHLVIYNVPVRFFAANEGLTNEAVVQAVTFDYQGVSVRVIRPVCAERDPTQADESEQQYRAKAEWHRAQARLPVPEKVRILLELQRQDYELLKRHRPLEGWERPWDIDP